MSNDARLATHELPDLTCTSLRDLMRETEGALDVALARTLDDDATIEVSAGFQSRV